MPPRVRLRARGTVCPAGGTSRTSPLVTKCTCRRSPVGTLVRRHASVGAHFERGLVGARDEHDVGAHDVGDRAREQRDSACSRARACRHPPCVTGASSRSASTCTWSESTSPCSTNSTKPGQAAHVSSRSASSSAATAGTHPTRSCRPCRSRRRDPSGHADRGAQSGFDHTDDRDVEPLLQMIERGRRRAVARDDDHLHVALEQEDRRSRRSTSTPRPRASGRTGNRPVSPKYTTSSHGNEIEQRPHDREAAESAVEHADRLPVVTDKTLPGCARAATGPARPIADPAVVGGRDRDDHVDAIGVSIPQRA